MQKIINQHQIIERGKIGPWKVPPLTINSLTEERRRQQSWWKCVLWHWLFLLSLRQVRFEYVLNMTLKSLQWTSPNLLSSFCGTEILFWLPLLLACWQCGIGIICRWIVELTLHYADEDATTHSLGTWTSLVTGSGLGSKLNICFSLPCRLTSSP